MKAVIFGAGNIGRGFIAPLFSFDGWDVTFIDVSKPVIERINADGEYPLNIVAGDNSKTLTVKNVRAVDGNNIEEAVEAIANCDACATCVGAGAIKYILPNFIKGVKKRFADGKGPINLLICENLMDADLYIKGLLEKELTTEELETVGLVETSVGRMVPVPKAKGEGENPLSIAVEEYGVLPVDKAAFKGEVINVKNIVPFTPFHYYVERKLYIHNMGHAICAYLGKAMFGDEYIYQSIERPIVRVIVEDAMIESAMALSKKYDTEFEPLMAHVWDLIRRFGNKALGDTCARVGGDIPRKLAASDRLVGASKNVLENGGKPVFVCLGAAAALYEYMKENPEETDAVSVLAKLSSLSAEDEVTKYIMYFYPMFKGEKPLEEILSAADALKKSETGMIV
ncbi:MAG: mannitol dehydrogenase [Ruminococcaceae bacterium]|nr:mannitol dehydrogenase [Oscillospiraceae bacterium]